MGGMTSPQSTHELEIRIARLEEALTIRRHGEKLSPKKFGLSFPLLVAGLYCANEGLGLPNHPYQWALGGLAVALGYHRRWLHWPAPGQPWEWILAPLNAMLLAMLFKLLIGSGIHQPLAWVKYPEITNTSEGVIPSWSIVWQASGLAAWQLDLTLMQTFLLLVTLIGALFRFQPFTSFTAILLILTSVPAFASFSWTWVFPAMATAAVAFYVQSAEVTTS